MRRANADELVARTRLRSGGDANAYADPRANRLLAALPPAEYDELLPHLEAVRLRAPEVLFAAGAPLRHVYFPTRGLVSLLYLTGDGYSTEIAVVGDDGFLDCAAILGSASAAQRPEVRVGGHAYRVKVEPLVRAFRRGRSLHDVLLRYVQGLMNQMAQKAVCNRHHALEQQLCRWLLPSMTSA